MAVHVTPDPLDPAPSATSRRSPPASGAQVELALSVEDDLLALARLTVSALASRAGFDVEEIEDLRLAVDELCLLVLRGRRTGRMLLTFTADDGCLHVWCRYDGTEEAVPDGPDDEGDLSERILDALVDEHGLFVLDGRPGAHLTKWRSLAGG